MACYGDCNGAASVTVLGGTPSYSYLWQPQPNNGQGTDSISSLCPGLYSVEITDLNGCVSNTNVTINEPNPVGVSQVISSEASGSTICDGSAEVIPMPIFKLTQ